MNVVLIGMSGAGKSTLGVLLAKALGMDFIDTDIVIQQHEGRLLQEIINQEGADRFLMIEEEVVSAITADHCVIATGGSVVYSKKAMEALKRGGQVIYIHADYEEIEKRLTNITTRGIVLKNKKSLKEVYEERAPLYQKYSDQTVFCTKKDIEGCVNELVRMIQS